ncbi:SIS domain-containing protein [Thermotoga sp.]|uniref:SIS domain-containing protein n=1 Tax=Thermotoga sp. TaxID=28240 RepID=UPI0025D83F85|nr:SIS domain-containing protein [Thermotoga sp.]MCD6551578.1 SIS domain-containing protein [Thermotoga sp.]
MPVEEEIFSQPKELSRVLEFVSESKAHVLIHEKLRDADEMLFIGCGSSYYIGITAARYFTGKLGVKTTALPAGEFLLSADWNLAKSGNKVAFLISRSGSTSEVVRACEALSKMHVFTIGITLEEKSQLAREAELSMIIPIKEESIVMTKSFSSITLFLLTLAEFLSGKTDLLPFKELINVIEESFPAWQKEAQNLSKQGTHYVFLGTGPYEGIARESALKLQEMSLTTTESYSTLEYRHGPEALVEPGVVVVIYGDGEHEQALAQEIEGLGGRAVVRPRFLENYEDSFIQVIFAQLLGLEIAKKKGIDVENPRNLTKVVRLDG